MQHRWLAFLIIGFVAAIVFIFFYLRLQPAWVPEKITKNNSNQTQNITQPSVSFVNPKKGALEPKITVVVFSDFQCQPCGDAAKALDELVKAVPEVQVVWKNLPNESAHESSVLAAIAAQCAAEQNKFWEYHDLLFEKQVFLTSVIFPSLAQELDLDTTKFQNCFDTQETLPLIRKDFDEAVALQITATPTFFIGKERISGALSASDLISWVKQNLASAK